jgi:hypothetical protein
LVDFQAINDMGQEGAQSGRICVIARKAKPDAAIHLAYGHERKLDCFVSSVLAMTEGYRRSLKNARNISPASLSRMPP